MVSILINNHAAEQGGVFIIVSTVLDELFTTWSVVVLYILEVNKRYADSLKMV
jgi:hypothetical protein